jgi:hypothetical protein
VYDIGDEDLAKSFNPQKVQQNSRTPKVPTVVVNYSADLISVVKDKSPKAGKFYAFKFAITKSNNELVPEGAVYREAFYPGASEVDNAMFWDRVTPLLMAVFGETNVLKFDAVNKLGELLSLSKETDSLGLGFRCNRITEEARPDKQTGIVKHKNPDGTPKVFPRDTFIGAGTVG